MAAPVVLPSFPPFVPALLPCRPPALQGTPRCRLSSLGRRSRCRESVRCRRCALSRSCARAATSVRGWFPRSTGRDLGGPEGPPLHQPPGAPFVCPRPHVGHGLQAVPESQRDRRDRDSAPVALLPLSARHRPAAPASEAPRPSRPPLEVLRPSPRL